jgi:hypothetical protein
VHGPPSLFSFEKMERNLIILNVGGTVFKTLRSTLQKFPDSKLGKLGPSSRNYIKNSNEYFFDRSPEPLLQKTFLVGRKRARLDLEMTDSVSVELL